MKTILLKKTVFIAIAMMMVSVQVMAKIIVPLGQTSKQPWTAKYYYAKIETDQPAENWNAYDFDDTSWGTLQGPISKPGYLSYYETAWNENNTAYWVRVHFTVDRIQDLFYFTAIHDDGCIAYINGKEIYNNSGVVSSSSYSWKVLDEEMKDAIQIGDNVLAVYVADSGGGDMYMDFGLSSNDQNDIVTYADVPVTFTNDATYPWIVDGTEARNGNSTIRYSTSWLTMQYSSTYRTELIFDWYEYNYSQHQPLQLYIDGVLTSSTSNSSWTTKRIYLSSGKHIVAFRDSIGNYSNSNNRSGVRNIHVREIKPLETAVLSDNSKPLTFSNEGVWPWTIEDGYIQNSNYGTAYSTSKFSTTFTIDKLSKFSFDRRVGYWNGSNYTSDYYDYHRYYFKINDVTYSTNTYATSFGTISVALEPGTYTMEWQDTIYNYNHSNLFTQIRNIELSDNWVEVDLSTAGTLGVEVLYVVDVLTDVELLKVRGPINSTDWATLKQMNNLLAIELCEATFTSVPNSAFDGLSRLSNVKLPEGPTSIGSYAFRGTQLLNIDIPNSVTSIGEGAFYETRVRTVNFGEESQLTTIGYQAFRNCSSLVEFLMPNTVTKLGTYGNYSDRECNTFRACTSLTKIHFSDALSTLEQYVCCDCSNLKEVHLPRNLNIIRDHAFHNNVSLRAIELPTTLYRIDNEAFYNCGIDSLSLPLRLSTIENYAFSSCKNLKYIELPSYIGSYDNNFYGCTSVQTIVSRSATPPSITNDPFRDASAKSAITLKVPSFAVVNYKLDSYWYQFGSIIEGDDIDYWMITSPLSLTNNRRMQGKPDIDLYYGGQFTVGGNAPMETGLFNLYVSESTPGRLLNTCESMTADSVNTYFAVSRETWYFFTPIHDVDLTKVTVSNGASFVFRYYDSSSRANNGTGNSWRNVDNGKLTAGQGYIFRCNSDAVISMPSKAIDHAMMFNTKDVTKPLSVYETTVSANKNWNYVGNPYPCYYDIYYMDFTAPITVWNGSTYKAYSIADDNYVLRPMQSFFVQKPDAVDKIVFHKEGRQLTTDINHASKVRANRESPNANRYLFNLQIANDDLMDETRVVLNEKAQLGYEIECDAAKFVSFNENVPQVSTLDADGNAYAINERPLDNGNVLMAYYAGKDGFYTISITRADGDIYLHDKLLNKTVSLNEQDYIFRSEGTNGINTTRFTLSFNLQNNPTGLSELEAEPSGDDSPMYDLQGRKVDGSKQKKGVYIQKGRKVVNQ